MRTSSVFLAKKGLFPDLFNSFEGSSVGINATRNKHRTLSIVFRASKPKEVRFYRLHHFWTFLDIWAPFYHHGNGDAAAPAHPRYLNCLSTNSRDTSVRDTDSDYVMRKPSRCWLGAVPRYWNVVASCFRFISLAENTSAALAPRAGISQPILLLFFCFLALEFVYKTLPQIFLIRSQNLVAFERG